MMHNKLFPFTPTPNLDQDRKGYTTVIEDLRLKCIFQ